jgi:uncharacterized protein YndB with AHSA1/START domain
MRTDAASRLIRASPTEIFAALIDPAALVTWLPPDGMTGRLEHFDARPGGSYRLVLTYDEPGRTSGSCKPSPSSPIVPSTPGR